MRVSARDKWNELSSLIEVISCCTIKGETSEERRLYISSRQLTPEEVGIIICNHWSIENRLHWNMDVNFCEDANCATVAHAAANLAELKRLTSTMK